jgi:hypothetical protein
MLIRSFGVAALGLFLATQLFSAPAEAQVWVSSVTGSDAYGCGFPTGPCRTLQYAVDNGAATNGGIKCLDAVNEYMSLIITKPTTIDCTGAPGLIYSYLSGIAVQVNISEASYPNGVVTLRGLTIVSHPGATGFIQPGVDGIRVTGGGAAVHVENVTIQGFSQQGIDFVPSSTVDLFVSGTTIINNQGGGILVAPSGTAGARVSLSNVRLDQNGAAGLFVFRTSGASAAVTIEDTNVERNVVGLRAYGGSAFIILSGSTIAHNSTGLQTQTSGVISSSGNNTIILNGVNGVPSSTIPLK